MRGRTVMGLDDMGGTGAGRIQDYKEVNLVIVAVQETVTIQNAPNLP